MEGAYAEFHRGRQRDPTLISPRPDPVTTAKPVWTQAAGVLINTVVIKAPEATGALWDASIKVPPRRKMEIVEPPEPPSDEKGKVP